MFRQQTQVLQSWAVPVHRYRSERPSKPTEFQHLDFIEKNSEREPLDWTPSVPAAATAAGLFDAGRANLVSRRQCETATKSGWARVNSWEERDRSFREALVHQTDQANC